MLFLSLKINSAQNERLFSSKNISIHTFLSLYSAHKKSFWTIIMTYSYQWFSAPKEISIVCPTCQKEALFQFASVFHIEKKQDRIFFETHPAFETTTVYDSYTYTHKFCVIFYPALNSNPELDIFLECHKGLNNSVSHLIKDKGVVFCPSCLIKRKHQLN